MSLVPAQRSTTFWLSLAPWTGEQLRQLQQRSKSEPLVRRCAVWAGRVRTRCRGWLRLAARGLPQS